MKSKVFAGVAVLFIISLAGYAQWDSDAGLIDSATDGAIVIAKGQQPEAVIDKNLQTKWESPAPLPSHYLSNRSQNIFLNNAVTISSNITTNEHLAIDGNTETSVQVGQDGKQASLKIAFNKLNSLKALSVKISCTQTVRIFPVRGEKKQKELRFFPNASYQLKTYQLEDIEADGIIISSNEPFTLFEIGGLKNLPEVLITIDLLDKKPIGWIETKHYAGEDALEATLWISEHGHEWEKVAHLNPKALNVVTSRFPERNIRFIRLKYILPVKPWAKAYLWEITAYDSKGPYGPVPDFSPPSQPLKNTLGINTFWGWGMHKHADELPKNTGPYQFSRFSHHVRYYHNIDWDTPDPDIAPDFENMPGSLKITWLDWDREFQPVWDLGYQIQLSLQIPETFKPETWDTPFQSAFQYAKNFGAYFNKKTNYHIDAVEIGNEPWKYGADFYHQIFQGMLKGFEASETSIEIIPCALSANRQQSMNDHYIGKWLPADVKGKISALNTHLYSYAYTDDGQRIAVHPEHPRSSLWGILNMLRFRDKNLPAVPIQVTEWGWDSDSKGTDCHHPECVSEKAQAAYTIRGMLLFYRLGVQKMFWYFHADEDKNSFQFTRSGLTTSPSKGMVPKLAYYALRQTIEAIGNEYLIKVVEQDDLWVYFFSDAFNKPTHVVMWIPHKHHEEISQQVTQKLPSPAVRAFRPDGSVPTEVLFNNTPDNRIMLKVGTFPVIISLQ
jgi:hypothetical protein